MMQPGSPQALMPPDESTLMRRVQDLERQVRELVAHNVLAAAGVRTEPGRFIIEGDLEVPNGKIKNEWLENAVTLRSNYDLADGFAVPNVWTEQASTTIDVPAGYDTISYAAVASVNARNDSGATQYLYAQISIQVDGTGDIYSSTLAQITLPNGYWGTVIVPQFWSTGLWGSSWRFWLSTWAGGGFSAHVDHSARIEVQATFSR
jgi:hypothetical protein